jgi:phosphocarrier protein
MLKKRYTVKDASGLHARPAGLLVKEAQRFQSVITLTVEGRDVSASAKGLFALLGLEVVQGDVIVLCADGSDEQAALAAVGAVIEERLGHAT